MLHPSSSRISGLHSSIRKSCVGGITHIFFSRNSSRNYAISRRLNPSIPCLPCVEPKPSHLLSSLTRLKDSSTSIKETVIHTLQKFQKGLSRALGAVIALSICTAGVPFGVAPSQAKLTSDEEANIKVFNTSKPSVVSVTNLALRRDAFTMSMMEFPQGVGSGFVWDEDGHVVTNYHVINDSANVKVTLGTDELLARVVGVDPDKDVAVLQVLPATISLDPTIDTKKKPKSVSSGLEEVLQAPALSDVDWGQGSSSSSSSSLLNISGAYTHTSAPWVDERPSDRGSVVGDSHMPSSSSSSHPGLSGVGGINSSASQSETRVVDVAASPREGLPQEPQQQSHSFMQPTLKRPPGMPDGQSEDSSMVLKVPKAMKEMQPLCLASSKNLQVGQKVYAVGNPFGLDHTLTTGVVSGTGREIQSLNGRPIIEVIQTDAAINPGNSGGPLLDSSGCVIGITTAIYSSSGTNTGVGFAIPTDTVRRSVEQILKFGKVVRPMLGISFAPDQASEQLGVKGIMVLSAMEGGPAWKAGIQGTSRDEFGRLVLGDIIRAANGEPVRSSSDLYKQLDKSKVGDKISLEVLRGSSLQNVDITLEANSNTSPQVIIVEPKIPMVPIPVP